MNRDITSQRLARATFALMSHTINRYLISNVRNDGVEKALRHRELVEDFLRVYATPYQFRNMHEPQKGSTGPDRWTLYKFVHDETQPLTNNLDKIGLGDDTHYEEKVVQRFHDEFIALALKALEWYTK